LAPPVKLGLEAFPKLRAVYVVMPLEPPPKPVLGGGGLEAAGKLLAEAAASTNRRLSRTPSREALLSFLEATATVFRSSWTGVAGYQVSYGTSPPVLLASIPPTALLWLHPGPIEAEQEAAETKVKGKDGKETVKSFFNLRASFKAGYRLESWPDRGLLVEGETGRSVKDQSDEEEDLDDWAEDQEGKLLRGLETRVASDLAPHPVARSRMIHKGKGEAMKKAFDSISRTDFPKARDVWAQEAVKAAPDEPEPELNLAAVAEREQRWADARAHYQAALLHDKGGYRDRIEGSLAEIDQMTALLSASTAAAAGAGWFDERLVVLPFSNDTLDVEAPARLREGVAQTLANRGYSVLPIEEADERLRTVSVTQGEHLRTLKPARVAAATGASRLLFGKVEEFRTINVGVYQRSDARMTLKLTDAQGNLLWEAEGEGFTEKAAPPKEAAKAFLTGLGKGLLKKALRIHMDEEAAEAVRTALETLPGVP